MHGVAGGPRACGAATRTEPLREARSDAAATGWSRPPAVPVVHTTDRAGPLTPTFSAAKRGRAEMRSAYAVSIAAAFSRPSSWIDCSRILYFWTFPETVIG